MYKLVVYNDSGCIIFKGMFESIEEINKTIDSFILYSGDTIEIEKMY